jgi:putative transposase
MRTKPKSLLGRLNRTNFRKIQFMIDYKSKWNNIPVQYVNPKNTRKSCSICGEIGTLNNSTFACEKCGLVIDRNLNASINILKIGMAPCSSWSRLPKVEDLKNQISEVALMKKSVNATEPCKLL